MTRPVSILIALSLTLSTTILVLTQLHNVSLRARYENEKQAEQLLKKLCTQTWSNYGLATSTIRDGREVAEPYNLSMNSINTLLTMNYEDYRQMAGIKQGFKIRIHYLVKGHISDSEYSKTLEWGSETIPNNAGKMRAYVVITDAGRWMQAYIEVYAWSEG